MSDRIEIEDELLDNIDGGAITYTWDGNQGSLGVNGNNPYQLVDKSKFLEIYNDMFGKYNDAEIIKELKKQGVVKKP